MTGYESLTPHAKAMADQVKADLGDVWFERFIEAVPYLGHQGILVGVQFALGEAATDHAEHAEEFWKAVLVGIECVGQRMADQLIEEIQS